MDLTDEPAKKALAPHDLKVFADLPRDERVTTADEFFVPAAVKPEPPTASEWTTQRDAWMKALREDCFRAWPVEPIKAVVAKPTVVAAEGLRLTVMDCASEAPFQPALWLLHRDDVKPENLELVVLNVLDDEDWNDFRNLAATAFSAQFPGAKPDPAGFAEARTMLLGTKWAMAYFCPRHRPHQLRAASATKRAFSAATCSNRSKAARSSTSPRLLLHVET